MAALGGSNTAGGGLHKPQEKYFNIVTDLWNKNIYKYTGSTLTHYNMAIRGCGSDFFSTCFQNYLPEPLPDLVLVDQAVNDYGIIYGKAAQPNELLIRRLLLLPSKPLVMYVNLVNPRIINGKVYNQNCANMQDWGFDELAMHYGIPSFSMKDFVCPLTKNGKRQITMKVRGMFADDGLHTGFRSHAKLASMIIEYFENIVYTQLQDLKEENPDDLPSPLFNNQSLISDIQLAHIKCWSEFTPNWTAPILKQTLNISVIESQGFRYISPKESMTKEKLWRSHWHTDGRGGWKVVAGKEKKVLRIHFNTLNQNLNNSALTGDSSFRSVIVIVRMRDLATSFRISIDEDPKSCVIVSHESFKIPWSTTRLYPMPTEISPGNHTLKVESMYGPLRVCGLAISYHGYHGYEGYKLINETITKCYK